MLLFVPELVPTGYDIWVRLIKVKARKTSEINISWVPGVVTTHALRCCNGESKVYEPPLIKLAWLYGHKDCQISMGHFNGKKEKFIYHATRQSKTSEFFTLLTESHPWNLYLSSIFPFPSIFLLGPLLVLLLH